MEDYKKKYKEALERVREQYNKRTHLYDIESIFSELQESEDERSYFKFRTLLDESKRLEKNHRCRDKENRTIVGVNIPEEIFPELKESEDERIKKQIRELLLDSPSNDLCRIGIDVEKTLAWLEKQGEKDKPKEWCAEDEQNLNVVLSFIPDECLRRWLKDKLSYDLNNKLDADKVIEWLNDQACLGWIEDIEVEKFVEQFRKDFGL